MPRLLFSLSIAALALASVASAACTTHTIINGQAAEPTVSFAKLCDDSSCAAYTWVAHTTGFTVTPATKQLCIDAHAELATRCQVEPSNDDYARTEEACARTALFYTDEGVPDSGCLDAFDCKTGRSNCESTTTNGDHFCSARITNCGSPCRDGIRDGLNHVTFGMKYALIDALQTCAAQSSCEDVDACLAAWLKIFQ